MRLSRIVAPVALALAAVLLGIRWLIPAVPPPARPAVPLPAIGAPFPHLALTGLAGLPLLTDATLRGGRPTLVNLFASWCVPCRAEAPQLAALHARGIDVAGIAVRDTPAEAAAFIRRHGSFTAAGLDPRARVQAALGTTGIPETWLIDGDGIVRARFRGDLHGGDVATVAAAVAAARR